jgi:3-hydroxymyristoyl/3-hydroxydecanoyl-(acyl carrier protein) dehydratase
MSDCLTDISILDLLPQRPPFIMVDQLTHFDMKSAETVFTVCEDNLFCVDGVMEEAGLVENIAQTCAARTGLKQHLENGNFSLAGLSRTVIEKWLESQAEATLHCEELRDEAMEKKIQDGLLHPDGFAMTGESGISTDKPMTYRSEKVKIGVIGMISMLEMKRRPLVGEVLKTSMDIEEELFSTTFVRSKVMIGDEIIATCQMKLYLTDKTPK